MLRPPSWILPHKGGGRENLDLMVPEGDGTPSESLLWCQQGLAGLQGLKFRDDLSWARHRLRYRRAFDRGLPDLT
jgi:hypothetical protein